VFLQSRYKIGPINKEKLAALRAMSKHDTKIAARGKLKTDGRRGISPMTESEREREREKEREAD
jgi:hypothetical protein